MKSCDNNLYSRITKKARKAFFYNTFIQIEDNSKVIVESCRHITECNDIMVRLVTYDYNVTIWGTGLTISGYNTDYIVINGKVDSVEIFAKRSERKNDI